MFKANVELSVTINVDLLGIAVIFLIPVDTVVKL